MPTGPKGQKRPADVIGNAIRVAQIATGEAEEEYETKASAAEVARMGGRKGGEARARALSPEQRKEVASRAAKSRWKRVQAAQVKKEPT